MTLISVCVGDKNKLEIFGMKKKMIGPLAGVGWVWGVIESFGVRLGVKKRLSISGLLF